jgi:hypothetical protein
MAVARRPPRPAPAAPGRCHGRARVGLVPWAGGVCLAGAAGVLLAALAAAPAQALALAAAGAALLLLGRETAVPAGLLLGADPWMAAAELVLLEAGAVLLLAPRIAGTRPPAVVAAAARRRNGARRPSSVRGIYLRALVPFAFLGPLVAILMGEAARLPPRRLLAAVLGAGATATAGWALLEGVGLHAGGPPILVAALAVAVPLALLGVTVSVVGGRPGARVAVRS